MNTHSGREKFRNFQIILNIGRSSTILMDNLTSKLKQKETTMNRWETQSRKFTTSTKANIYFCLPSLNATKIVTWKYHVDDPTKVRYDMILGRDLLTALGLDLNFFNRIIGGDKGTYEGFWNIWSR